MQQQINQVLELLNKGDLPQALEICTHLAKEHPNVADIQHLLGLTYAKLGRLASAVQAFSQAIELNPRQAIYHNNISNAYKLRRNFAEAMLHLHQALLLEPNNAESYNNLGSLYYTQGQFKQAQQLFEKAIRLNPNSWEAHYNLANCCIKNEMVLQAISHYQTVLRLNPQHGNAKLNLAMSWISLHDYTSALPLLEEAATLNPQHAELQGHLAEAYLDLGKSAQAIAQFNKALALEPTRAEWHHNLAVLYLRDKQTDLAKKHFAESLVLQPDNPTAQHMLNALNNEQDTNIAPSETAPAEYVSNLFDQYASYYNQHVTKNLKYQVPALLRQAISKYLTDASKVMNILDLGCGTGLCGVYFRDLADFLIGVDLSAEMLAHAKALGAYDGLCRCDILQIIPGYKQAAFDLVLAADVLVYIGDLEQIFSNIKNTLRSGGKFAFTVEDTENTQDFILQKTGRFAHSAQYIENLCAKFELTIGTHDKITLREQDDAPIAGRLYVISA